MSQPSELIHPNPHCPYCGKKMREHEFEELLACYAEHSGMNEDYAEVMEGEK